jgi:CheY-like chemotaxis protein
MQADALTLHWQETAGPETVKPTTTGFGTQIITGSIEKQLGGKTKFEWLPSGLRCTLTIPRGDRIDVDKVDLPPATRTPPLRARRVMVVEDEALVALVLADQLAELGLSVVGPCSSVAEAKAVADGGDFEAAILDVNLGGELVYPVADLLSSRGIPFVFVTGYGRESIDRRFADTPVLEKPVERELLEDMFGSYALQESVARTA